MRTKIFAALLLVGLIASCAWAKDSKRFLVYPTLGECTGNSVRLREKPNTSSEILGRLNESDFVVVLGSKRVNGETWYEIENLTDEGTAYIFGKYLRPAYREEYQRSPFAKMLMNIFQTYGFTEERNLALSGKPRKTKRGGDPDNEYIHYVTRNYDGYSIVYFTGQGENEDKSFLKSIDVRDGDKSFGNIKIGDSVSKLRRELGTPENENGSTWEYEGLLYGYNIGYVEELVNAYTVRFTIENEKISRMYFYAREDGEDGESNYYD